MIWSAWIAILVVAYVVGLSTGVIIEREINRKKTKRSFFS